MLSESERDSIKHTKLMIKLLRENTERKRIEKMLGPIVGARISRDGIYIQDHNTESI